MGLGTAGNYVILGKTAISTAPSSGVTGDIAVSPAAATFITGFSAGTATFGAGSHFEGIVLAKTDIKPVTRAGGFTRARARAQPCRRHRTTSRSAAKAAEPGETPMPSSLLLAALLAAAPANLEKKNVTIAVGGKTLFYYLPLTIAERLGYFKDEGLSVEIVDFAGGAKALQALMGGSADLVSGSFEHTVTMQARGVPVIGLVLQTRYPSIQLGLRKDHAASYKSPRDLKGFKIGVTAPGSSTNYFVNALLAKEGLAPDDVSIIGIGAAGGAVAAMERGELDALANLDPVMTRLVRDHAIVVVVDTRTEEGMKQWYGPDYAAACIYGTREFIEKNPNTVQAVVNAMVRALRFLKTTPVDKVMEAVPKEYYAGDKETWKASLVKAIPAYSADGKFSMVGAETVYKVLKLFDPSVMKADIALAATFDNRFVDKAPKR